MIDIDSLKFITNLKNKSCSLMFDSFAKKTNKNGLLSFNDYKEVYLNIASDNQKKTLSKPELIEIHKFYIKLYNILDKKNKELDFLDIVISLSLLCNDTGNIKISLCLALYDVNNTNYISKKDLEDYLYKTYQIIHMIDPAKLQGIHATPKQLANIVVSQTLYEANITNDQIKITDFINNMLLDIIE